VTDLMKIHFITCQSDKRNVRKLKVSAQWEQNGPRPGGAKKINV
jgi:hypothetical protein